MKLGVGGIEGTQTVGYFVHHVSWAEYAPLDAAITAIDSANRSNPNENQWMNLEEYNAKYGTDYYFAIA